MNRTAPTSILWQEKAPNGQIFGHRMNATALPLILCLPKPRSQPYPANRHPWLLSRHDCYSVVVFAGVKLGLDLLECVDRILHVLHGLGGGEHVAEDDHRAEDAVVPRAE